jgi:hypothetical protein
MHQTLGSIPNITKKKKKGIKNEKEKENSSMASP